MTRWRSGTFTYFHSFFSIFFPLFLPSITLRRIFARLLRGKESLQIVGGIKGEAAEEDEAAVVCDELMRLLQSDERSVSLHGM